MKIVINKCFGGFGLSAKAVKRLAELQGRECYFFRNSYEHKGDKTPYDHLIPLTLEQAEEESFVTAYDAPNPNDNKKSNDWYEKHSLYYDRYTDEARSNPLLIQVVEELGAGDGTGASGHYAHLKIVEVPDGVSFKIEEYDGNEHIAETHQTWS